MTEQLKTRLAALVPQEKLDTTIAELNGESTARIEAFLKVLTLAKQQPKRLPVKGQVANASINDEQVIVAIGCTVNSLATRLNQGQANIVGILDDMVLGQTTRSFSLPYVERLASAYGTSAAQFVQALNGFGGEYSGLAKLRREGDEWSDEGEVYTSTHYADEKVSIKLSERAVEWLLSAPKPAAEDQSDPFDNVKAEKPAEDDEPMPF